MNDSWLVFKEHQEEQIQASLTIRLVFFNEQHYEQLGNQLRQIYQSPSP